MLDEDTPLKDIDQIILEMFIVKQREMINQDFEDRAGPARLLL